MFGKQIEYPWKLSEYGEKIRKKMHQLTFVILAWKMTEEHNRFLIFFC